MNFPGANWILVFGFVLFACLGSAQNVNSPANSRQPLSDAWWTGPMLAPNASTLPRGRILVEPYFFDVISEGFFDSEGTRHSAPHSNEIGSLTYFNYGLFNKFTVGMIPTFGYNVVSQGNNSSSLQVGDLTVQGQYRLHLFHEESSVPTISVNVQETLPTGKYDQLGAYTSNGLGGGAFTTALSLYSQTFFWMPNGRILRARFNVTQAFSQSVTLEDVSVYGTSQGFRGRANPGASFLVDLASEYSLTRHWVLASDATYRHQYNTPVSGYNIQNPATAIAFNSGSSQEFGLAPAVEYNLNSRLGVLVGTRFFSAGKNVPSSISPAIAVNYVH
jgi:hypothetical protein